MSEYSSIEWTDATWNPIRGVKGRWSCVKVSPGCVNCYAETMNRRFGGPAYAVGADTLRLDEEVLNAPLRWRKPRRVFVCSMTDLFEERVPAEWIYRVWLVMRSASHHTFQVLTKRAARMREILSAPLYRPPPPNVWLGVSVEDQGRADERIQLLLQATAAVRFVSYEPALGPVDFSCAFPRVLMDVSASDSRQRFDGIDWLIVGGESGPKARPCDPAWIPSTVRQCREAGVPVFVKQDSGRWPGKQGRVPDDLWIKEFPKPYSVEVPR